MIQPGITLLLILAVFSSICQQAPATSTRQYELGTTYSYHYTAAVLLNEAPPLFSQNATKARGTDVGYQITATVELTPVWQNPSDATHMLFELLMSGPKLSVRSRKAQQPDGFVDHSSPLDDAQSTPVYIDWNDGHISHIYALESETVSLNNLKKGIASLFQLQTSGIEIHELDTSGNCTVTYNSLGGRTFLKMKNNCQFQRPTSSFSQPQKILGFASVSSQQTKFNLKSDSDIVDTLTSTEVHAIRVKLRSQVGASVISRQYLRLNGESKSNKKFPAASLAKAVKSIIMSTNVNLIEDNLQLVEESVDPCETSSCKGLKKAVNDLRKNLHTSNVATPSGAGAFAKLLPIVRRSSKVEILALLKDSKNKPILPQLMDVVAAAQTPESYTAAIEAINFQSQDIDLAERFLQVVSLSTHPSEDILLGLLQLSKKIKSEKLSETALLSLAAVTRTFASNPENAGSPLVAKIHKYVTDNLEACSNEECKQLYMRVLRNLGSVEMLPILLAHIDSSDRKTSVWAVKAVRALPASVFLDGRVKDKLQRVYFQMGRRYDSSARTLALDTLLEHEPEETFLLEVLTSLSMGGSENLELNTYTLQRLQESAENDPILHSKLKQLLSDRPFLNTYHVFAQNGMSTTFSRVLYRNIDGNGTFSSSTEAVNKMMKRAAFDVYVRNSEEAFQLLSVGLFTGGLGSLMGFSSTEGEEEEATAGMEVTLAGVQLRPIVFFTGQGELMGHVWSGTASERTTALQATVLLQDHRQAVVLQSGFIAVLDMRGSVSFDFGGEIQISIWNRNSHSVVEDIAAWQLDGSLRLDTPFVKSSVDFTTNAASRVDFVNDVSFANGILLCLRMGQAEFHINYTVQKRESIPGTKHWIHKKKKRKDFIPGRTFKLNDQNSGFCNEMFPKT
ncbi:hypothetical protein GHT06_016743 [Daphnia sinensis]|uniref:Vitellogenin domain-containing protein n=1 Tax=Daphnia sinensis TaxID=1820382 RepID=A0AAD5PU89_9CRUS|nr:hypothetical protein GHT06_016743 [Daphnia sinensis]